MDIFLYAFSVMYSPGPVNFMGLNAGLTGQFRRSTGFFIGDCDFGRATFSPHFAAAFDGAVCRWQYCERIEF